MAMSTAPPIRPRTISGETLKLRLKSRLPASTTAPATNKDASSAAAQCCVGPFSY